MDTFVSVKNKIKTYMIKKYFEWKELNFRSVLLALIRGIYYNYDLCYRYTVFLYYRKVYNFRFYRISKTMVFYRQKTWR